MTLEVYFMFIARLSTIRFAVVGAFALILSACSGVQLGESVVHQKTSAEKAFDGESQSVFGEGGISFGDNDNNAPVSQGNGIGVNAFLWRATLDTVSFMPLTSADPFGGVILTDWYSPAEAPNERYKLNIYILGQALRADGIRVAAFRQLKNQSNDWQSVNLDPKAVTDIENSILTRARQLRTETRDQ